MALNGLLCADVPLRTYTLTQSLQALITIRTVVILENWGGGIRIAVFRRGRLIVIPMWESADFVSASSQWPTLWT